MIKVGKTRAVRETTAPYIHVNGKGEETLDIRVRYFSHTWNELQAQAAQLKQNISEDPDAIAWPHELLAKRIESLPDLAAADGSPFAITVENLGDLDTRNLEAIRDAIDKDFAGKPQAGK